MQATLLSLLAFVLFTQQPAQKTANPDKRHGHPAFTLVQRVTVNKADGVREVSETTRYVSSHGSVRNIDKRSDGTVASDYLYEKGKGGFYVQQEGKKLVKSYGTPPEASDGALPTADSLQADPNFARTETVLGYTAYVLRETAAGASKDGKKSSKNGALLREHYYAPELGFTPLKVVRYMDGKEFVVYEPTSVTFGEPDPSLFKAPEDYVVSAPRPIVGGVLNGKAISKPVPPYPAQAVAARASGVVTVQITVSEDGTVEKAEAVGGHPLLREAAVEAARRARFSPTRLSGQPVKVTGVVTYNFVLQ
ncbi:MAG TPA: energy transducer TonB [Pyrinomonadaceae bacterium]|nr:energy transducer TonB [Pyrinomonadaceae bacterium]